MVRWAERRGKVGYMYQADARARVLRLGLTHDTQTALVPCEYLRHLTGERAERYMGHWLPCAQGDDIFGEGAGRLI